MTIAISFDFECPFCRRFAETVDSVFGNGGEDLRVVFHHLPLSMHKWVRVAAEGAACAQLQSSQAFWVIHDNLFRNQETITIDNVKQRLRDYASASAQIDRKAFETCLDNGMSIGLILRDLKLAEAYEVNGTPTVFINGRRLPGVQNAAELEQLINATRGSGDAGSITPVHAAEHDAPSCMSGKHPKWHRPRQL